MNKNILLDDDIVPRKKAKFAQSPTAAEEEEELVDFVQESLEKRRKKGEVRLDGYEEESDAEDSDDEEDAAERRNAGDMEGLNEAEEADPDFESEIPIEPFNLKREKEEGAFDKNGFYVEKKDLDAEHDIWLKGILQKDIKRAAEAKRKQDLTASEERKLDKHDLYVKLLKYLVPGETPSAAIQRLGNSKANEIAALTEILDDLLTLGDVEIYEETYEDIRAELVDSGYIPRQQLRQPPLYEYKWEENGEIFGPFDQASMRAWQEQGFFMSTIWIRKVHKQGDEVVPLEKFHLLLDKL